MIRTVRTRFAPSPTGSIHFGNIRSALYTWAFARKMNGIFVLRIEDTDINRSSQEAVDAIIETMTWLGIDFDEGPFFQTDRIHRYQDVLNKMIKEDLAYPCYMSKEELEVLRDRQRAAGEKPRYDRTWRPEVGKILPKPPSGVKPLLRFKNPLTGVVSWNDAVKGQVIISNEELDDLVIARSDGTPTYNFCVVVDDLDMEITHVIRGDDHLSNTPRQINILRALGGKLPIYVHLPTLMNENGKKMSKRHSMISVMAYRSEGYLSEAIINYLARLGWSHGDSEIFSIKQFIKWFDFEHLSKSPAQHNHKKLKWINSYYIKEGNNDYISILTKPFLRSIGIDDIALSNGPDIVSIVELMKKRTTTLKELAESAAIFYREPTPNADELSCYTNNVVRSAIRELATVLKTVDWNRNEISAAINKVVTSNKIKLAQLAMPVRLLIAGTVYTPSIDILLALFSRDVVISRLESGACE